MTSGEESLRDELTWAVESCDLTALALREEARVCAGVHRAVVAPHVVAAAAHLEAAARSMREALEGFGTHASQSIEVEQNNKPWAPPAHEED